MLPQRSIAIVGANHPNKKGPTRRFELKLCNPGEPLELRPEPTNRIDPQAIAVYSCRGVQIGYVRAEQTQFIGTQMKRGGVLAVFQREEPWGCTARVSLDGTTPILPVDNNESGACDWPPPGSDDPDWWPDETPPDD
jgi:hypothetical protein